MIILSVGMPRAGSGWYYNLTNALALAGGYQDAREIRRSFRLQKILTEVNCNIGALTPRRLLAVSIPALLGRSFVIKAHAGPTPLARRMIRLGILRPLYIYRDPRDALLSAHEVGRRSREAGRENAFAGLNDFEKAVDFMLEYVRISEQWLQVERALHTRYERFRDDYDSEAGRVAAFLKLDRNDPGVRAAIEQYRPHQASAGQKGTHFNQGKTGRFRQKFSLEQREIMEEKFGPYLETMGYEI